MQIEYAHKNLQGSSFKGQNLSNANFSNCDIRGANFTNAILTNANFTYAKGGLQPCKTFLLLLILSFFVFISGFTLAYASALIGSVMFFPDAQPEALYSGIMVIIILNLYVFLTITKGLRENLGIFITVITFSIVLVAGITSEKATAAAIIQLVAMGGAIASGLVASILIAILRIITRRSLFFVFCFILATLGGSLGSWEGVRNRTEHLIGGLPVTLLLSILLLILSIFIGFHAAQKDSKFLIIYRISNYLASLGGTSFRGADLTNANFTEAKLANTDLRNAVLKRTCWFMVKHLEYSLTMGTYLDEATTLNLVLTKDGRNKIFDQLDLRQLNLDNANLIDASFINSDLSESTLQNADLSRAKLVQTRLYRTNLTGVLLTGTYIQDWAISTDTRLENVMCEYIYMHLPTQEDPDPCRKPDNRQETFKEGEFEEFISPIIKTLDLYRQQGVDPRKVGKTYKSLDLFHHEGIDPSAAAIALKQLAEQYPEAGLEVVALEGRGDEKIRLQARVTGQVDRSQLSAEYFTKYQEAAALPYSDMQSLLAAMAEKDQRIRSLENMVMTSMQSDKFYVETYYDLGKCDDEALPVRKILILTANPKNTSKLRLDAEVREIQTGLERAKKRDQFEIITKWAVRPEDLRRALLDYEPQIVHFSGHGTATEGLALENETGQTQLVSTHALASLFEVFKDKVECVLLNACYSVEQAEAIRQHIPYVIGMNHEIGDRAALEFAVGFYDALGAGRSIDDAFKLGCISIDLEGIPEALTPVLKHKDSVSLPSQSTT